MKTTMTSLVAATLLVSSCVSIRAMPVGHPAAPRMPGCAIREEHVTPREAEDRYEQVGVLCYIRLPGTSTEKIESPILVDDVREDACRLGGEIVVRQGFCNVGRDTGIGLGVYVARAPHPIP